jgi:DNA-binding MarR family transcriptional regulator
MSSRSRPRLADDDFVRLLSFRDGLRRFLHWSEVQAKAVGLTATQHQLLLAIRGHREPGGPEGAEGAGGATAHDGAPSIGAVAEHLLLRHHSAVELVDRAQRLGLVERVDDDTDQRVVRLRLTAGGEAKLAALAAAHLEELSRLQVQFATLWDELPADDLAVSTTSRAR